jgi:hypothetical protein
MLKGVERDIQAMRNAEKALDRHSPDDGPIVAESASIARL